MGIADDVHGYEKIWIIGDGFVHRTSEEHLVRPIYATDGRKFFMKENYEVKIYATDRYNSNNPSILSRLLKRRK